MRAASNISAPSRAAEPPFVTRIRLRAKRRALWMRHLWSAAPNGIEPQVAITHEEMDRHLFDPEQIAADEAGFYQTDVRAKQLAESIDAADGLMAEDERWSFLRREFGLSSAETDLLSLAVAAELNPALRRVYAYLADDAAATCATLLLAADVFKWPSPMMISPQSPLLKWDLARLPELASWSLTAAFLADSHIVRWIADAPGSDLALGSSVTRMRRGDAPELSLHPELLLAMGDFLQSMQASCYGGAVEIELAGPEGSGKLTLAGQLSASLGRDLLCVDAAELLGRESAGPAAVTRAMHAVREARLAGAILYWRNADAMDVRVWRAVRSSCTLTLWGVVTPRATPSESGYVRRSFRVPALTFAQRSSLWRQITGGPMPEEIGEWMLTPAELECAARSSTGDVSEAVESCRQMLYQAPGELFNRLPLPYTWDDIVLPSALRNHLTELEDQARWRRTVYEDWGFERLCPLGKGISALFAGPSGTGKTMAAQVLARSLGRELYRVDLAAVVNKYIGETEKRLKLVFDTCERSAVVLFFDEADALFGQRTQVKDAHDRFANIQIDYLLQRMEQFDGIAILATNRKADLDPAFLRRIRFIVDFLPPGPNERIRLWELALPARSPEGEELLDEIDWNFLAMQLNMTGANIKSAALAAAFRARVEGKRIGMSHLLSAARREMAKQGAVMRAGELGA